MSNTPTHDMKATNAPIADIKPDGTQKDKLGRGPFISQVSQQIENYQGKSSLVVSIEGGWGEGKSFVIEKIKKHFKNKPDYLWVTFNPWHFVTQEDLSKQFLQQLSLEIRKNPKSKFRKLIHQSPMTVYFVLCACWAYILNIIYNSGSLEMKIGSIAIPSVILYLGNSFISNFSSYLPDLISKYAQNQACHLNLYEKITKSLRNYNKKIIIQIEDMDRLPPEQIRDMVQLIRMVADFDHTIYLLGYDRPQVIEALSTLSQKQEHKDRLHDGRAYLQKIVHAAYTLPQPKTDLVAAQIYQKFTEKIQHLYNEDIQGTEHWINISQHLTPLITNLRQGQRIVNRALLLSSELTSSIEPIDLLSVSFIIEDQPNLWAYISQNYSQIYQRNVSVFSQTEEELSIKTFDEIETLPESRSINSSIIGTYKQHTQIISLIKALFLIDHSKNMRSVEFAARRFDINEKSLAHEENFIGILRLSNASLSYSDEIYNKLIHNRSESCEISDIYRIDDIDFNNTIEKIKPHIGNITDYGDYLHQILDSAPIHNSFLTRFDKILNELVFPFIDTLLEHKKVHEIERFISHFTGPYHLLLQAIIIFKYSPISNAFTHVHLTCIEKPSKEAIQHQIRNNILSKLKNDVFNDHGFINTNRELPDIGVFLIILMKLLDKGDQDTLKELINNANDFDKICLLVSISYKKPNNPQRLINLEDALFLSQKRNQEDLIRWFLSQEKQNKASYSKTYFKLLRIALENSRLIGQ